ncbi:DUF2945 domain-containing protein [Vannielia litorea]|uniref:DUF2945 domain-containing protein n=1 Tax=Vannielia litorea TaxID=1217970 RepID=UPI001C95CFE9|nr:DUF2945 domain-containing protein [Vannielia litorea]MBY6153097.1 DUF2945 domain-containing protein [Vannielia litorea]
MSVVKEGDRVKWDWGQGTAEGKVRSVHEETVERKPQGEVVKRTGSKDDPALYIEQDDGDRVLKLASEVRKA